MSSSLSSTQTVSNTCSSGRFSWIVKSCFPNPQHAHNPSPIFSATTIAALPDDILLECLIRVHRSTLPYLPSICRRWAHLLNSPAFHLLRTRQNLLSHTLFSISISNSTLFTATLRLTNDTDTDSPSCWRLSSFIPGNESPSSFSSMSNFRLVSIGRKIYIIGRESMLRCDTWTGTLVPKAAMNFQRKKFAAATIAGKIYVAGGWATAVEEYDPDENVWRVVSEAPRRRYGCIGASVDGVFYVIGGLQIGNESRGTTHSSMDLYDVTARVWLRSRTVPNGGCVMTACSAADCNVYILSSHAVELSFWKFNSLRKSKSFGEWCRLKSPPLPAKVGLDSKVRFCCVGVMDKVMLVQVVGCADDLFRSGRIERGMSKDGVVLVYDCSSGEWSKGDAYMPCVVRRAACVSVEF